jgi:hypothetical protein
MAAAVQQAGAQVATKKKEVVRWREWVRGWFTIALATARERPGTAAAVAVGGGARGGKERRRR